MRFYKINHRQQKLKCYRCTQAGCEDAESKESANSAKKNLNNIGQLKAEITTKSGKEMIRYYYEDFYVNGKKMCS